MKGQPLEGLSRQAKERLRAWQGTRPTTHLYDAEGEFRSPQERTECKVLSIQILDYLNHNEGWHSTREILDAVGRDHIRLFDCAISNLVDSVESKDLYKRTAYRRADLRRIPWEGQHTNTVIFTQQVKNLDPIGAMIGEKDA